MNKELIKFPSSSYPSSWRIFRTSSDENSVTAQHLAVRPSWPKLNSIKLLDIGAGDGLLANEIVKTVEEVDVLTLIDPFQEWLSLAAINLKPLLDAKIIDSFHTIDKSIQESLSEVNGSYDVFLLVHVVYFLQQDTLREIIEALPKNKPLYVVLDEPNSVFSRIWAKTKPSYLDRAKKAHELINELPDSFRVERSNITSHLSDPLKRKEKVRDSLLSILSYSDFECLSNEEQDFVVQQVKNSCIGDRVHCESACYEILKI